MKAPRKETPASERARLQREGKLRDVAEQVASGGLIIRQMTDAEREHHGPARPSKPRRPGSGR